jgi:hypothetical protein
VVTTATIRNASDLPVFVVEIAAYHPDGQLHELWGRPEQLDVFMAYGTRRFWVSLRAWRDPLRGRFSDGGRNAQEVRPGLP